MFCRYAWGKSAVACSCRIFFSISRSAPKLSTLVRLSACGWATYWMLIARSINRNFIIHINVYILRAAN